jgi:hypothetical protein
MQFPRCHHRQMVDGAGWTSFEALHRLAAVASAPLTASKREGVSPFMGLIWTH